MRHRSAEPLPLNLCNPSPPPRGGRGKVRWGGAAAAVCDGERQDSLTEYPAQPENASDPAQMDASASGLDRPIGAPWVDVGTGPAILAAEYARHVDGAAEGIEPG